MNEFNTFSELVKTSRSYRRFYEDVNISYDFLKSLVELSRYCPSAANAQALKFKIVSDVKERDLLFKSLHWAAALPDWDGPEKSERPSAYIMILTDTSIGKNKAVDVGICAQTIMLGAASHGFGGCMLASIDRPQIIKDFAIDSQRYTLDLVLALGKPKEDVRIINLDEETGTKYFRDENQVHYVPKRLLKDIIL